MAREKLLGASLAVVSVPQEDAEAEAEADADADAVLASLRCS